MSDPRGADRSVACRPSALLAGDVERSDRSASSPSSAVVRWTEAEGSEPEGSEAVFSRQSINQESQRGGVWSLSEWIMGTPNLH